MEQRTALRKLLARRAKPRKRAPLNQCRCGHLSHEHGPKIFSRRRGPCRHCDCPGFRGSTKDQRRVEHRPRRSVYL